MHKRRCNKGKPSLLPCENLDLCCEVIRLNNVIWEFYMWAYPIPNEFLSPSLKSTRMVTAKLDQIKAKDKGVSPAPGCDCSYPMDWGSRSFDILHIIDMPQDIYKDEILHISIEGLHEIQKKPFVSG